MKRILAMTLLVLITLAVEARVALSQNANPTATQDTASPDKHALKLRHLLEFWGLGQDITARLRHGRDYHGRLVAISDNDFKIDEVDLRQLVTIRYNDIKRVDCGYMQRSLIGNTRRNPHTSRIVAAAVLGGLAAFLIIVLHSGLK